jgi:large subunit ribosomal protein L17
MRHRIAGRQLNRTAEHRLAMRRNLVASLMKAFAEKLVTLAKKGTLSARRRAIMLLGNRDIIDFEDGKPVRKGTIIGKLFSDLGPRYLDRPGGYTRIIRLSQRRLGDNGRLVLLQFVGKDESTKKQTKAAAKKASRKKAKKEKVEETTEAKTEVDKTGKQQ